MPTPTNRRIYNPVTGSYYTVYERTDKCGISDPVKGIWGYKSKNKTSEEKEYIGD